MSNPIIRIRKVGAKAWYFLMKDGGSSRRRIHAVRYPSLEAAQAEINHIKNNYPEFEAEAVE